MPRVELVYAADVMPGLRFDLTTGMIAGVVLLVAGGAVVLLAPEGSPLHAVGLGIVVLAMVVYLAARVTSLVRDRHR